LSLALVHQVPYFADNALFETIIWDLWKSQDSLISGLKNSSLKPCR
jgi:hypothetical protein